MSIKKTAVLDSWHFKTYTTFINTCKMGFFSKAKKLMSTVVKHYDTAKNIATMINDNLPEEMILDVP